MGYGSIYVRQIGDISDAYKGASINEDGTLVTDKWDGNIREAIIATEVEEYIRGQTDIQETHVNEIKMDVIVTDSRIIYRCDNYDKGGTWSGGLTALALTGIERAAGKIRTRGKSLLGHIRYEWIMAVGYELKKGFFSDNKLYIFFKDNEDITHFVRTKFKKSVDIAALANDVLHRCSKYRLAMTDDKDAEDKDFFEKYSLEENVIEVNENEKENYQVIKFPSCYRAPNGEDFRPDI